MGWTLQSCLPERARLQQPGPEKIYGYALPALGSLSLAQNWAKLFPEIIGDWV